MLPFGIILFIFDFKGHLANLYSISPTLGNNGFYEQVNFMGFILQKLTGIEYLYPIKTVNYIPITNFYFRHNPYFAFLEKTHNNRLELGKITKFNQNSFFLGFGSNEGSECYGRVKT
jgi:hypothetical protein